MDDLFLARFYDCIDSTGFFRFNNCLVFSHCTIRISCRSMAEFLGIQLQEHG